MADQIRATPQNATLGAIANFLKQTYAPQRTQQMQGVMELLGVPALARTAERMSYGEPVTNINKANVPLLPADTAEAAMLAGPPLASLARRVGTNLVQTAPYVARDLAQSMTSPMRSYVVKPKGGNWLAGSVESSIEPMKTRVIGQDPASRLRDLDAAYAQNVEAGVAMDPAVFARERARLEPEVAMNRWLESKLGKYIKNEMATPEDPLRALAESFPAKQADQLALKDAQIAKAIADLERAQAQRGVAPEMLTSSQARLRDLRRERQFIADQTGLHAEIGPTGYSLKGPRAMAGFPEEGMGVSPLAKTWEDRADTFINQLHASDLTRGYPEAVEANPWLAKVPPETRVYEMLRGAEEDLGFAHLADELRNAINPESGLPESLLLKYQDLEKLSVPQAAQRVSEINAWRAGQKADADLARASNIATQVFKEYPDSPQGLRWVELRQPKETGRKISVEKSEMDLPPDMDQRQMREVAEDMAFDEGLDEGTQAFDDFVRDMMTDFNRKKKVEMDESIKALEDALKYEGETMGHCVGGYCPDVVEGRSKIYSLRDKKGQPHVTIEVQPGRKLTEKDMPDDVRDMLSEQYGDASREEFEAAVQQYLQSRSVPDAIVQIKGKANRAPNAEYLPAVQDFVRSGNFGKIGDLQNAGLVDVQDPNALLRALGKVSPERNIDQAIDNFNTAIDSAPNAQRYMTLDELRDFLGGSAGPEGFSQGGQVRGYDAGGVVSKIDDPARGYDWQAIAEAAKVAGIPITSFMARNWDKIMGGMYNLAPVVVAPPVAPSIQENKTDPMASGGSDPMGLNTGLSGSQSGLTGLSISGLQGVASQAMTDAAQIALGTVVNAFSTPNTAEEAANISVTDMGPTSLGETVGHGIQGTTAAMSGGFGDTASGPSSVGPSADSNAAGTADSASESSGGDGIGGDGTGVGDSSSGDSSSGGDSGGDSGGSSGDGGGSGGSGDGGGDGGGSGDGGGDGGSWAKGGRIKLSELDKKYAKSPTKRKTKPFKGNQVRGYAEGGQVSGANFPTGDFDPARIDTIVGELHALNAG